MATTRKPVQPLYPSPPSLELKSPLDMTEPGVFVCHDPGDAATLQAIQRQEQERFRLFDRLGGYKMALLQRLAPYCDLTQEHSFEAVISCLPSIVLPPEAPGEVRDALTALRVLATIHIALIAVKEITPAMKVALCAAIDLGMLLQRGQAEHDFAGAVDVANMNQQARKNAVQKRTATKQSASEKAFQEFQRRKEQSPSATETDIINTMAAMGYGTVRTLYRYKKDWPTDTSAI